MLTLTLGGDDFLPQYVTSSAKITSQIRNQGDTLSIGITQRTGQSAPTVGKEIIFKDGSRYLFGGFITRVSPTETGIGQLITYTVEATDYTYVLVNKSAQESYASQTLGDIVADLMSTYVDAGYGLTQANVATGPTIATVSFNHISLRKCFENLSNLTGYIWWIGYDRDIHFVDPATAPSAPEAITDAARNHEAMSITIDASQVRNDIVVEGGKEESASPRVEEFLGDGVATSWTLQDKPKTMVSIELNTGAGYVTKTFGVDPLDEDGTNYFMFNYQEKFVRLASGSAVPTSSHKIRVTYNYEYPIITELKELASITAMQAIEGGDGVHAYTITDTTIESREQSRERARKELDQYANPILSGRFTTRTGLLSAGSYFQPGQALIVNLPSWGIAIDTTYVIQKVQTTMTENDGAIEYHYDVTFGGRLLGVVDFLQALASPETPIREGEVMQTIYTASEVITVAEAFASSTSHNLTSETVTLSESFTNSGLNFGTIFVAGPYIPSGPSDPKRVFCTDGSLLG